MGEVVAPAPPQIMEAAERHDLGGLLDAWPAPPRPDPWIPYAQGAAIVALATFVAYAELGPGSQMLMVTGVAMIGVALFHLVRNRRSRPPGPAIGDAWLFDRGLVVRDQDGALHTFDLRTDLVQVVRTVSRPESAIHVDTRINLSRDGQTWHRIATGGPVELVAARLEEVSAHAKWDTVNAALDAGQELDVQALVLGPSAVRRGRTEIPYAEITRVRVHEDLRLVIRSPYDEIRTSASMLVEARLVRAILDARTGLQTMEWEPARWEG